MAPYHILIVIISSVIPENLVLLTKSEQSRPKSAQIRPTNFFVIEKQSREEEMQPIEKYIFFVFCVLDMQGKWSFVPWLINYKSVKDKNFVTVRDLEKQIVGREWLATKWFWDGNSAKIYLWKDSFSRSNGRQILFERISRAVRTNNKFSNAYPKPFERMGTIFFKRIAQAVWTDDNFFWTDTPSRSNGYQIRSKTANHKKSFRVRGHAKALTKYVRYVH